jgi:hypothetical protein
MRTEGGDVGMKPIDQTTFGDPGGNCFSACVASLLELPIEAVPYFMADDDWYSSFQRWLAARGLYALTFSLTTTSSLKEAGFYILGGRCSRGSHAVVARGTEIAHDPHPSREGLTTIEDATMLIPMDPSGLGEAYPDEAWACCGAPKPGSARRQEDGAVGRRRRALRPPCEGGCARRAAPLAGARRGREDGAARWRRSGREEDMSDDEIVKGADQIYRPGKQLSGVLREAYEQGRDEERERF